MIFYIVILCFHNIVLYFLGEENSSNMAVSYTPGLMVWVKCSTVWWPGQVIEKSDVPEELEHLIANIKNCIAVVYFSGDDS